MWWWLLAAIVSEVCGSLALRTSEGFTRLGPVLVVVVGYAFAIYALSQTLTYGMNLGTAYAICSALGICAIAILGVWLFGDAFTVIQVGGIALVVMGIVLLQAGGSHG